MDEEGKAETVEECRCRVQGAAPVGRFLSRGCGGLVGPLPRGTPLGMIPRRSKGVVGMVRGFTPPVNPLGMAVVLTVVPAAAAVPQEEEELLKVGDVMVRYPPPGRPRESLPRLGVAGWGRGRGQEGSLVREEVG